MEKSEIFEILEAAYFGETCDEALEMSRLSDLVNGVDFFIDLGASLGPYTFRVNNILHHATLVAVEADPLRVERLRELTTRWAAERDNEIVALHCAAGGSRGSAPFVVTDSNISGSLSRVSDRTEKGRTIDVELRTIDDIVEEFGSQARKIFIKIDIEGGEFMALYGARQLIQSGRDVSFLIEMHAWGDPNNDKFPHDCFKLMRESGFRYTVIGEHYLFSRTIELSKCGSYEKAIWLWRIKEWLRQFSTLRSLNRALKEFRKGA